MTRRSIFKRLLEPDNAIEVVAERIGSSLVQRILSKSEEVSVLEARGRLIAENIEAPRSMPWYPRSLVDGCAVKATDVQGAFEDRPIRLRYAGRIVIGTKPDTVLRRGECIEVDTGSWVPVGADSVVPIEYTRVVDGTVYVERAVSPGQNIAMPATDVAAGDIVAFKGQPVNSALVSALTSLGVKRMRASLPVTASIFSTGVELVEPGDNPGDAGIFDSNRYYLIYRLSEFGWQTFDLGIIGDTIGEVEEAIGRALDVGSHVIIASGGTSAGLDDVVYRALGRLGEILVHGLRIKPGKPTLFGTIEDTLFMGLPGNPRSCANVFDRVSIPLFTRLGILAPEQPVLRVKARLATRVSGERGRHTLIPVVLLGERDTVALPISIESYMIASYSLRDGLVEIKAGAHRPLEPGEEVLVEVYRYPASTLLVLTDTPKVPRIIEMLDGIHRPIYRPMSDYQDIIKLLPDGLKVIAKEALLKLSGRHYSGLHRWRRSVVLLKNDEVCKATAVPVEYTDLGVKLDLGVVVPVPRITSALELYRAGYVDCAITTSEHHEGEELAANLGMEDIIVAILE